LKRAALAAAFGLTVFIAVYAVAATMGLTSDNLGAGAASVTVCDGDGFTVDALNYETTTGLINGITIGDIAADDAEGDCLTGQLTVHLTNTAGASLGSGTASVNGAQVTVGISPHTDPAQVAREVIIIVGP
jgi:hypothetical protein